jgi:hypothetical protein
MSVRGQQGPRQLGGGRQSARPCRCERRRPELRPRRLAEAKGKEHLVGVDGAPTRMQRPEPWDRQCFGAGLYRHDAPAALFSAASVAWIEQGASNAEVVRR